MEMLAEKLLAVIGLLIVFYKIGMAIYLFTKKLNRLIAIVAIVVESAVMLFQIVLVVLRTSNSKKSIEGSCVCSKFD